ncbi:hypothetical protein VP1G_11148 [Cytospora mali]|uniref:Bacteriophage T5 Orf172 DNA-binding domain-containing protein n=1 Tax=Cytospora mali TaxID=578113 RepID=A0A194V530_CYTMA|nr:hypothetical protein VP1G_11148 [Valsa mali var. pyri (nom. inval.)]
MDMSTVYEIALAPRRVRSSNLTVSDNPLAYRHVDSARHEDYKRLASRRETKDRGGLGLTLPSFLKHFLEQRYEKHKPRPQQLGPPILAEWLLEHLYPLCYKINQISSRYDITFQTLEGPETFHNDQSTIRGRDQSYQDDLTQQTHTDTNHLPPYTNIRSQRNGGSDGGSSPPERRAAVRSFDQYGSPMTIREINERTKRLLLGDSPATEGYVYGFTHPDDMMFRTSADITQGTHLIKIGRSIDYERRMREFRRSCKYVPYVIFAYFMPHHFRIEMIVHIQLHNVRLRDVGCTGCGARHEEWFHVDIEHAERLVSLWKGFANCRPYDEQGEMLPLWRERLEGIDLEDEDCWERFIRGIPSGHPVADYLQELEDYPDNTHGDDIGSSSDEQARTRIQ